MTEKIHTTLFTNLDKTKYHCLIRSYISLVYTVYIDLLTLLLLVTPLSLHFNFLYFFLYLLLLQQLNFPLGINIGLSYLIKSYLPIEHVTRASRLLAWLNIKHWIHPDVVCCVTVCRMGNALDNALHLLLCLAQTKRVFHLVWGTG